VTTVVDQLVESVTLGTVLDLTDAPDRTVPAGVIRDVLRGKLAPDPDPRGLRLSGAVVGGRLDLVNVVSSVWLELTDCVLPEGINAYGAQLSGLDLSGSRVRHPDKPAVNLAGLTAGSLTLDGTVITADSADGALVIAGARIDGDVSIDDAEIKNSLGSALQAERVHIGEVLFLNRLVAEGAGEAGAVRLVAARIGSLQAKGARLRNPNGPAVLADRLDVPGEVVFSSGFEAAGAVRLVGARIGGSMSLTGARIRTDSGPALNLESVSVGQHLHLNDEFAARGAGPLGAVLLMSAQVGGALECVNVDLQNYDGPALNAALARFGASVFLGPDFIATGGHQHGAVNLLAARAGNALFIDAGQVRNDGPGVTVNLYHAQVGSELILDTSDSTTVNLDGLTYPGLPGGASSREWLRIIRDRTPRYTAQPYQQLAAAHRAAGHDGEARRVLMAQRRDQIARRALTGRLERTWARFTGFTLGYGYQPWRALIGLVAVVGVAVALSVAVGDCRMVDRIGVGLNLGAPLIRTGSRCATTSAAAADFLTVAGWVLTSLGWAFATLFVAGFTGVVRKS
jgi:hypothetical protein